MNNSTQQELNPFVIVTMMLIGWFIICLGIATWAVIGDLESMVYWTMLVLFWIKAVHLVV